MKRCKVKAIENKMNEIVVDWTSAVQMGTEKATMQAMIRKMNRIFCMSQIIGKSVDQKMNRIGECLEMVERQMSSSRNKPTQFQTLCRRVLKTFRKLSDR